MYIHNQKFILIKNNIWLYNRIKFSHIIIKTFKNSGIILLHSLI